MNLQRFTAMALAVALTGLTQTLAAEENIPTAPDNDNAQQNITRQKSETEKLMTEVEQLAQTTSSSSENLLSELKVYPSF